MENTEKGNEDTENQKKSTHDQYTEAYVGILSAYKEQLSKSVKKKNALKKNFFDLIKWIMGTMVIVFGMVIILSLVLMGIMVIYKSNSTQVIVGAIVSIISSFVTLVLGVCKLPKIIAEYLFNKEEDQLMKEIIENIQKYELNADKTEKMRKLASVDATMNSMLTDSKEDLKMKETTSYLEPADLDNDKIINYASVEVSSEP